MRRPCSTSAMPGTLAPGPSPARRRPRNCVRLSFITAHFSLTFSANQANQQSRPLIPAQPRLAFLRLATPAGFAPRPMATGLPLPPMTTQPETPPRTLALKNPRPNVKTKSSASRRKTDVALGPRSARSGGIYMTTPPHRYESAPITGHGADLSASDPDVILLG